MFSPNVDDTKFNLSVKFVWRCIVEFPRAQSVFQRDLHCTSIEGNIYYIVCVIKCIELLWTMHREYEMNKLEALKDIKNVKKVSPINRR